MKYKKLIMAIAITATSISLSGCVSGPTQTQMTKANYGPDMSPEQCVAIAERVISSKLKDPNSAEFKHSPCYKGYMEAVPIRGMNVEFGWIQRGEVNAKNSYGGYVGPRRYMVLINEGFVLRYCIDDARGACAPTKP